VALFYKAKKDAFEAIAKKHLDGLASWTSPTAGMFLFLDLHIPSKDSAELIRSKAVQAGFLAVPGTSCMPSKGKSSCVRTSFSLATPEGTEEAFRRLAKLLREENGHAA
jgi:tryptophan aminotransferase